METIQAPNGTKFIKPEHDCVLLEIHNDILYGRYDATPCSWFLSGTIHNNAPVKLTPAPKLWYEDIGKGKLCWVWNYTDERRLVDIVHSTGKDMTGDITFKTLNFAYAYAQPLTQEEALEYIVKG
jgi:hypothetical protein